LKICWVESLKNHWRRLKEGARTNREIKEKAAADKRESLIWNHGHLELET